MESPQTPDLIDRSAAGGGDRRCMPRQALPLSGRWTASGRWVHVLVENLSLHGAALSTVVPLTPGDHGVLSLEGLGVPVPSDVRWSNGGITGVRFHLDAPGTTALSAHIDRHAAKARILMPWALGPADAP